MTFTHPAEVAVLRVRLESEDIECRVLDELTVQVHPFYSNAIGGVKLQVKENDLAEATRILKEGGYIKDEAQLPESLVEFDRATSHMPLLRNLRPELRLMVVVAGGLAILTAIIYFTTS